MDIIFYITIFIIGTLFGSFYTLAVYRIPKRQDITHTHSYCPNCNHKLGFLDLIPVLSYIFLGGKCRYCKEKIRPRYLILEILSGTLFLAIAILINLKVENLVIMKIMQFIFLALYSTFIILISGIDLENRKIDKLVSIYGVVISILYMVYLCIVENASIYRYVIYLIAYIIMLVLDTLTLKRHAKNSYLNGILLMIITMVMFTGEYITANAIILTLLAISIYTLINKLRKKKVEDKITIGFYLGISNLMWLLIVLSYNYIS